MATCFYCGGGVELVVEFLEKKDLHFYVAVDARRSAGSLDLKLYGGFLRLQHAEIINGDGSASWLS